MARCYSSHPLKPSDFISKIKCIFFADPELPMFYGNLTDYFKILDQDESTVLIGAR